MELAVDDGESLFLGFALHRLRPEKPSRKQEKQKNLDRESLVAKFLIDHGFSHCHNQHRDVHGYLNDRKLVEEARDDKSHCRGQHSVDEESALGFFAFYLVENWEPKENLSDQKENPKEQNAGFEEVEDGSNQKDDGNCQHDEKNEVNLRKVFLA